jgi:nucleotide-binding universal stress UspA family protein
MIKILIPVDGSEQALLAVQHGLRLVEAGLKARFLVANVQESANLYEMVTAHDPVVLQEVSAGAGKDLMRSAVQRLQAAGVPVEQEVGSGDPAHVLVDIIERHGCEAVIMSTRGSGLRAAVMGSVSQAMVQHSPVPVTLVKVPDDEDTPDESEGVGE